MSMKYNLLTITVYNILLIYVDVFALDSCKLNTNSCEECIIDFSKCVWCAMVNVNDTRCRSVKDNIDNWCVGNQINPVSGRRPEEINMDFNSNTGEIVQIKPQNIKIDLRPGDFVEFEFSIKPAKDYPVDLYFLIDASKFMKNIKQNIVDETENIYSTMKTMTKNVFLGTGSFIDKNTLPFTRLVNSTLAYSFRNRLKLTDKFEEFQRILNETEFGSNNDEQEGTLDALSQVITCEKEIGWRKESTKIILVLTDGPYHSAGDGQWAGIYRPYDGKCYTENGIYKNELVMDYPSVSIINKLAAEREIIIIFVVKKGFQENIYNALSNVVRGSKVTNFGSAKSFSMNRILKEQYKKIRQQLKLKVNMDNTLRHNFQFEFDPNCYETKNFRSCKIQLAEKKFIGKITLLKYIEANDLKIQILAEGINEKLSLDVNIIKKCNCSVDKDSKECDSAGTLRCGLCECNSERYGVKCKCDIQSKALNPYDNSTCISPSTPDKICSGFGACDCGKCSCINKDYSGSYCECHKNMCPLYNDLVCADHGDCVCGNCNCAPGFTAHDCRCPLATDACMDNDIECNNRGRCVCGSCQCYLPSDWDVRRNGDLCELNCTDKSCHNHQCQLLEPIAVCYLNQKECQSRRTEIYITGVENLTNDTKHKTANYTANSWANDWNNCPYVRTSIGCYTAFQYQYNVDSYGIKVEVQTKTHCAETYYIFGGVFVLLLVVASVVALICWKVITTTRDRREYERFAKEAGVFDSQCVNPIYTPASSTIYPGFRKRSDRRKSRSDPNILL